MVAAFVITVVMAGGLLAMSLLWVAIAGLSPEFLRSVLEQQPELFDEGLSLEQVRDTVLAFAGAFIVWCVVALVLAGFAMARRDWARRGLMVIAAFSAVGCLFFVLATRSSSFPRWRPWRPSCACAASRCGAGSPSSRADLALSSADSRARAGAARHGEICAMSDQDPYAQPPTGRALPYGQPSPYGQQPYGQQPPTGSLRPGSDRRPGTVTAAALDHDRLLRDHRRGLRLHRARPASSPATR